MSMISLKKSNTRKLALGTLGATAVLGLGANFASTPRTIASDHIDSPAVAQDRGSDLADTWAFLDPNDNSRVVLMMSTQGFIVPGEHFGQVIFDQNIRYRFEIENTGDARPDAFVDVLYSPGVGRLTTQTANISLSTAGQEPVVAPPTPPSPPAPPAPPVVTPLPGRGRGKAPARPRGRGRFGFFGASSLNTSAFNNSGPAQKLFSFNAPTTVSTQEYTAPPPTVTNDAATGVSFFAGVAEDPFFLDDTGANRFIASSLMNPGNPNKSLLGERGGRDTYAGFNTLITAVSVPVSWLRGAGNVIGINAVTQRQQQQTVQNGAVVGSGPYLNIDRDGNPLVNNGLIPAARKNEYNGASTEDDANGRFKADVIQSLRNLGTDDAHINAILNVAVNNGDILRLNLAVPNSGPQGGNNPSGGFGNMGGRRLTDDVVDGTFTMINNGVPLSDFVNGNEVPFRDGFPFVADPVQPFPPGSGPDDRTRQ